MKHQLLSILTRTPLHVGAGSSVGAIDMPIQRERHTLIPIIPGSSLKGVLRDLWHDDPATQRELFGSETDEVTHQIGSILVGEARVLCFPVRSARGSFAWVTGPLALQRYAREYETKIDLPTVADEDCLAGDMVRIGNEVVLEEYRFKAGTLPPDAVQLLKDFLRGDSLMQTLAQRLVIVSDGIFSHFCAAACEVQQRIRIDDATGTVAAGGLFNQENVPSETMLYAVLGERKEGGDLAKVARRLSDSGGIIQLGGDETIGLGFCSVALT